VIGSKVATPISLSGSSVFSITEVYSQSANSSRRTWETCGEKWHTDIVFLLLRHVSTRVNIRLGLTVPTHADKYIEVSSRTQQRVDTLNNIKWN